MPRAPRSPVAGKSRSPLALRVQALRLERGLTQVELAVESGVSRSHIAKIETGDDSAGLATLQSLASFFGVSMDYLQTGEHAAPPPTQGRLVQDPEQMAWLQLWEAIPADQRLRVARMVKAAADDSIDSTDNAGAASGT